jgi:two-component system chemotaxis response regulator CheY
MKTLIAEDDFTSRLLLQTILSPYGECHVAVNGREAIEAFTKARNEGAPYDLLCLDIMMPEMDGQAALKEIRAIEEADGILSTFGVKIVMTTALGEPKNVIDAFMELCDAYIIKPVEKAKLLTTLQTLGLIGG